LKGISPWALEARPGEMMHEGGQENYLENYLENHRQNPASMSLQGCIRAPRSDGPAAIEMPVAGVILQPQVPQNCYRSKMRQEAHASA
jgi:hypothetical protein